MKSLLIFIFLFIVYVLSLQLFTNMEGSTAGSLLSLISMLVFHALLFLSAVKASFVL
jgi:hypothetical protein